MESQQIVDYIRQQLAAGYTEANLRDHLVKHGWSQAAVNNAFTTYRASTTSVSKTAKAKKSHKRMHIKRIKATSWTRARFIKLGVGFAVLAVVGAGVHFVIAMKNEAAGPPPKVVLTYPQKQSNDVSLIGGAVAQFAATYGDLPAQVLPASDGGLAFCGTACTVSELTLGSPQVYQPTAVKLMNYAVNLAAPDKDTMYLVPAAKCASTNAIGEASASPRSIVILYARMDGPVLKQRCVTL
jgi:hypothetical protein